MSEPGIAGAVTIDPATITPENAQAVKSELFADPTFRERYLFGHVDVVKTVTALNAALTQSAGYAAAYARSRNAELQDAVRYLG